MRIGIISTMRGFEWGGSEELWAAMAHRALEAGLQVSVYLMRPRPQHHKWEALEKAGADVFWQSNNLLQVCARRFARIGGVLHPRLGDFLGERLVSLPAFFSTQPDVLLVSDGGSIPSPLIIGAIRKCYASRPYLILSQANQGEIPESRHRKEAAALYRGAYSALFVSESNLRTTERQLLQRLCNGRVVRNPVNLDSTDPVDWPQSHSASFASVARLDVSAKGQDILLEVLSDRGWLDREWQLSIYGSGDDRAYLEEMVAYYGLRDRVSFRGQTEDIRGIWRTHHLLVLPSRYEGMPLAAVEAMLCGRPVVATRVAGLPEWICDGSSGFLAEAPTVGSFAQALEAAWQRRSEWRTIGNNARKDALLRYDPVPGDTLLSILIEARRVHMRTSHACGREIAQADNSFA